MVADPGELACPQHRVEIADRDAVIGCRENEAGSERTAQIATEIECPGTNRHLSAANKTRALSETCGGPERRLPSRHAGRIQRQRRDQPRQRQLVERNFAVDVISRSRCDPGLNLAVWRPDPSDVEEGCVALTAQN